MVVGLSYTADGDGEVHFVVAFIFCDHLLCEVFFEGPLMYRSLVS